jgi:hypothetical protein
LLAAAFDSFVTQEKKCAVATKDVKLLIRVVTKSLIPELGWNGSEFAARANLLVKRVHLSA